MTLLPDVYKAIESQLPKRLLGHITITILSDPYFIAPKVTLVPNNRPELVIEARLDRDFKLPDITIGEICLWA